jgi:hypothetical protein
MTLNIELNQTRLAVLVKMYLAFRPTGIFPLSTRFILSLTSAKLDQIRKAELTIARQTVKVS